MRSAGDLRPWWPRCARDILDRLAFDRSRRSATRHLVCAARLRQNGRVLKKSARRRRDSLAAMTVINWRITAEIAIVVSTASGCSNGTGSSDDVRADSRRREGTLESPKRPRGILMARAADGTRTDCRNTENERCRTAFSARLGGSRSPSRRSRGRQILAFTRQSADGVAFMLTLSAQRLPRRRHGDDARVCDGSCITGASRASKVARVTNVVNTVRIGGRMSCTSMCT